MGDKNSGQDIGNNEFHRQMITVLRPQIIDELHPSHVVFYMQCLRSAASDIFKAEKSDPKVAANLLVEKLLEKSNEPGWYTEFVNALREADFPKLAKRLSLEDVKDDRVFKELISLVMPVLMDINPMEIMPKLIQKQVINGKDCKEIQSLEANFGRHHAMTELLFRLPIRQECWFHPFVMTLKEANYMKALRALEPMLADATSDDSIQRILSDLERGNSEEFKSDPEKLKKLNSDNTFTREVAENSSIHEEFEYRESREPSLEVDAPNIDVNNIAYFEEKVYSKDQRLSDIAPASATSSKPVAAAARFPQSENLGFPVNIVQETPVKQVQSDDRRRNETFFMPSTSQIGGQQTSPKSVNVGDGDLCEPTSEICSDLNLVSVASASNDDDARRSNSGSQRLHGSDSGDNNRRQDRAYLKTAADSEDTTIFTDPRTLTAETEEREFIPNEVFVSNLPIHVTKPDLVEHFGMIGDIQLNSRGQPKVHQYRDKETKEPKGEALITYANDMYANAAIDIFNDTEFDGNMIKVELAWRRKIKRPANPPSPDRTVVPRIEEQELDDETLLASGLDESLHEELNLRGYQQELATKAKNGRNCVILAPTGSGKTHIAMEIIRNHVNQNANPTVVFFVPTVALVEQQRKQLAKYLKNCKILGLSGDQDAKLPLSELIPINDIIVLTPQILENALKEGDIETMSVLSLIILDECHHTHKNHPYNMIMSHYIDEKLDRSHSRKLPQVVGLTASVGVGKSKTMDQAVECILKLCANLDAQEICTVKENMEELMRHVNRPEEDTLEIQGRQDDPFADGINGIMSDIETKMKDSEPTRMALGENGEFNALLQSPAERGGDRYTQWISRLQKPVDALQGQGTRRFYVACLKDLQIYNTALLINADCRTKDALDYIVKEFNPAMVNDLRDYQDATDEWLKQLFEDKKAFLAGVSVNPRYENPKLNRLKAIILQEYDKAPDSRGIIFCKTREMTVALVNWMKDTQELRKFNPHNLVGTNAPSNKAGMTQVRQVDVLEYFKTGDHKLIVATSVAEEGLDVQKCNIVIRYEHVTNQIARVQSRGRARANNAQYLVVAEKGRGAAEKEEGNKIREKMMQKAIDIINRYSIGKKRADIYKYQREAQVEREMAKKGKQINQLLKASLNTNVEYELRCLKCDSFTARSTDIRKIEASHHVILDPDYKDRIKIRPHPAPKTFENFELTGKIFCKRCHADWGIMGVYKKVAFPIVKVSSLIIIAEDGQRKVYKRWKEVPFQVQILSPDDLQTMVDQYRPESRETNDDFGESFDSDNDDDDEFDSMYSN